MSLIDLGTLSILMEAERYVDTQEVLLESRRTLDALNDMADKLEDYIEKLQEHNSTSGAEGEENGNSGPKSE